MIADAVYLAIAGIAFCHAAGRSIFSGRLKVGIATLFGEASEGSCELQAELCEEVTRGMSGFEIDRN